MCSLDLALGELETATAALAEIPIENLEAAQAALDRRSAAVARLAEVMAGGPCCSEHGETGGRRRAVARSGDTVRRLRGVCEAGAKAQLRILKFRSATLAEWSQWSRIYRALGAEGSPDPMRVDCRG